MGSSASKIISPVSKPSSTLINDTPVTLSPAIIDLCIGAAPRYFGSNEPCRLKQPSWGISIIAFGRI